MLVATRYMGSGYVLIIPLDGAKGDIPLGTRYLSEALLAMVLGTFKHAVRF